MPRISSRDRGLLAAIRQSVNALSILPDRADGGGGPDTRRKVGHANADPLAGADLLLAEQLIHAGVFGKLVSEELPIREGTLVLTCEDRFRAKEGCEFLERMIRVLNPSAPRPQEKKLPGMPFILDPGPIGSTLAAKDWSTYDRRVVHRFLVGSTLTSVRLMGLGAVLKMFHAPCGLIVLHGFSLLDSIWASLGAKDEIKRIVPASGVSSDEVRTLWHLHLPRGMETRPFHRGAWREFCQREGILPPAPCYTP